MIQVWLINAPGSSGCPVPRELGLEFFFPQKKGLCLCPISYKVMGCYDVVIAVMLPDGSVNSWHLNSDCLTLISCSPFYLLARPLSWGPASGVESPGIFSSTLAFHISLWRLSSEPCMFCWFSGITFHNKVHSVPTCNDLAWLYYLSILCNVKLSAKVVAPI